MYTSWKRWMVRSLFSFNILKGIDSELIPSTAGRGERINNTFKTISTRYPWNIFRIQQISWDHLDNILGTFPGFFFLKSIECSFNRYFGDFVLSRNTFYVPQIFSECSQNIRLPTEKALRKSVSDVYDKTGHNSKLDLLISLKISWYCHLSVCKLLTRKLAGVKNYVNKLVHCVSLSSGKSARFRPILLYMSEKPFSGLSDKPFGS